MAATHLDLGETERTALLLLSLALRPLSGVEPEANIRMSRTTAHALTAGTSLAVGRTKFHAATLALAEDTDTAIQTATSQRRVLLTLERPEMDDYAWAEEVLDALGLGDLDNAKAILDTHGVDYSTPLPAGTFSLIPGDDDNTDADNDDDAAEVTRRCTKCEDTQDADAFPVTYSGRLSSWCYLCHRAATNRCRAAGRPALTPEAIAAAAISADRLAARRRGDVKATARVLSAVTAGGIYLGGIMQDLPIYYTADRVRSVLLDLHAQGLIVVTQPAEGLASYARA